MCEGPCFHYPKCFIWTSGDGITVRWSWKCILQRHGVMIKLWHPIIIFILDSLLLIDERYWKHRSRAAWLKGGDKNSIFFHTQTLVGKLRMKSEFVWCQWCFPWDIKAIILQSFPDIFCSSHPNVFYGANNFQDVVTILSCSAKHF